MVISPNVSGAGGIHIVIKINKGINPDFPKHISLLNQFLKPVISKWVRNVSLIVKDIPEGLYIVKISSAFGENKSEVIQVMTGKVLGMVISLQKPTSKPTKLNAPQSTQKKVTKLKIVEKKIDIDQRIKGKDLSDQSSEIPSENIPIKINKSVISFSKNLDDKFYSLHQEVNYIKQEDTAKLILYTFEGKSWKLTSLNVVKLGRAIKKGRFYPFTLGSIPGILVIQSEKFPEKIVRCPSNSEFKVRLSLVKNKGIDAHPIKVELVSNNINSESLLKMLNNGSIKDAISFVDSEIAENLLYEKIQDPIAATIGAYFLLKTQQFDRMHNWASNLAEMFDWMPDGPVIHAWQLIGSEKNNEKTVKKVRNRLLQAYNRGIPMYTEGARLLFEGLEQLASISENDSEVDTALEVMRKCIRSIDWSEKNTTINSSRMPKNSVWPIGYSHTLQKQLL